MRERRRGAGGVQPPRSLVMNRRYPRVALCSLAPQKKLRTVVSLAPLERASPAAAGGAAAVDSEVRTENAIPLNPGILEFVALP